MNEKPNWKTAPDWANYLAMDADGDWYWYETEPSLGFAVWHGQRGQVEKADFGWTVSMEGRP